jgi:glutamate-1-semialdehyde 2,1-aminomutase
MANGYPLACVGGKREIMGLGSIERLGQERVFLLSTTHGGEMVSLGAFVETIKFSRENDVVGHLWDFGSRLTDLGNSISSDLNLAEYFKISGPSCAPSFQTLDASLKNSLDFRTLFSQEMIKNGVLMPWISLAFRHGDNELKIFEEALWKTLTVYSKALNEGIEKHLEGPSIKPVFRKFN